MLGPLLQSYGLVAVAVLISAIGLGCLFRGFRIAGRRRRGECVRCGYPLGPVLRGAPPTSVTPSVTALSTVCTECGRDPDLDALAPRRATALIALGLAAQLVWVLLGAGTWTPAAVLLVQTSVAMLVFAAEPALERIRRAVGGSSRERTLPRRPLLRVIAALLVAIGWAWIAYRYERGDYLIGRTALRSPGAPILRLRVGSGTEWMERVLPPKLVRNARVTGLIAEVTPQTSTTLDPTLIGYLNSLWINGSLTDAARFIDPNAVAELRILRLDDETLLARDLPRLPTLDAVRVLSLDGSSLTPAAIERLLAAFPNLRILRVNYLNQAEAEAIRVAFPGIAVDSAEHFARPRRARQPSGG
jgi:hypothetical protein